MERRDISIRGANDANGCIILRKCWKQLLFFIVFAANSDPIGILKLRRGSLSKLEKNAFCLITDSGTIPEEALFFQKPCVTIRTTTERPEIIEAGSNILSGLSPDNILQSIQTITSKKPDWQWNKALGDGKTARKVLNILGGNLY